MKYIQDYNINEAFKKQPFLLMGYHDIYKLPAHVWDSYEYVYVMQASEKNSNIIPGKSDDLFVIFFNDKKMILPPPGIGEPTYTGLTKAETRKWVKGIYNNLRKKGYDPNQFPSLNELTAFQEHLMDDFIIYNFKLLSTFKKGALTVLKSKYFKDPDFVLKFIIATDELLQDTTAYKHKEEHLKLFEPSIDKIIKKDPTHYPILKSYFTDKLKKKYKDIAASFDDDED